MDMGLFFDPLLQLIDRLGDSGSYSGISSRAWFLFPLRFDPVPTLARLACHRIYVHNCLTSLRTLVNGHLSLALVSLSLAKQLEEPCHIGDTDRYDAGTLPLLWGALLIELLAVC